MSPSGPVESPDFYVVQARAATWVALLDAVRGADASEKCLGLIGELATLESARSPATLPDRVATVRQLTRRVSIGAQNRAQLAQVLGSLRSLDAEQKLDAEDKEWLSLIEVAMGSPSTEPEADLLPEMRVTESDLAGARFIETYRGTNIFELVDGRIFIDRSIALATIDHARATLDELARQQVSG